MARNHARLFTRIWNDEDFLDLPADAQRLYMMLLSQQNLSHAGLLPLTVTRWANKAKDRTVEQIETALAVLEVRFYVVIDRDTEELLVRTLMRGDEVWKHWKVMTAAGRDVEAIASARLRIVAAHEVAKMLVIEELSEQSRRILERLSVALPSPTDWQPEPDPKPMGQGKVTVVTTDYPPLPPSPAPTPAPVAIADDPTGQLLAEHAAAYAEPLPPDALRTTKTAIMRQVACGVAPERISAGLARMRERRVGPWLLPQLIAECSPVARPSTTDQRVSTGLALVEKYRAEEGSA